MKFLRTLRWPFFALGSIALIGLAASDEPDPGQIQISVGRLLEQGHYSRKKLDDNVSRQLLKNYLEALDYYHLYFTQKDVDAFVAKYGTTLDDDILLGNSEAAHAIFAVYKQRVEGRISKVKELLKEKYDFKSDRAVEINRQKSTWPKDDAEAEQLWRDRIENELLADQLSREIREKKAAENAAKQVEESKKGAGAEKPKTVPEAEIKVEGLPEKSPIERLTKRYDEVLRNLREQTKDDVLKIFLLTLSQTYDPHSEYLSRSDLENFSINMRLSLVGIGAVLKSEEGYAKIDQLVPGGPASKDGRLKVGDRVCGVAQGNGEFVDTVDMRLDKVVEMIRGKKDTIVRLLVVPVNATDPSERTTIEIKRDEVKLKEAEAKAEVIERTLPNGTVQRLGWITLPSFYADMENSGSANAKSTTKDVLALLNRLKQENITGLVMDLRRDGGGSLEEAVNLTGLFIKRGPVVQAKDANGNITVQKDRDSSVAYDGPMLVLVNRLSASASEIFAAALQDYNRALVVGDSSTFGKGTVQTMLEIGKVMPFLGGGKQAGALKLTIQKFYRIAGGSTQLKGVEPDIKLPSPTDHPEIGEASLKGPLPYDTVDPVPFDKWDRPLFKSELKTRSMARVSEDPEFRYIMEESERVKQRLAENRVSLNIDKRRKELEEETARKESRDKQREKADESGYKRYKLTLDTLSKPQLELIGAGSKESASSTNAAAPVVPAEGEDDAESEDEDDAVDPIRLEALNILADFVDLSRAGKTAATAQTK